jgi:hypothetical protein
MAMIEFPQQQQPPPPAGSRRSRSVLAVAAVLVLVVVVALVNGHRNRAARQASDRAIPPGPAIVLPTPSARNPQGQDELVPSVACPQIRDEQSRLSYRCIDDKLRQGFPDTNLGLRISLSLEVEPNWVVSEGSGNPRSVASPPATDTVDFRTGFQSSFRTNPRPLGPSVPSAGQVRDEVRRRADLALERAYGDNPSGRVLSARVRSLGGVQGYQLLTEITINPDYRARRNLTDRVERLWTVGLPTTAGVSIFMLSIPDDRADLWPKAEATIATVRVL